jgi:purine-binding chemotaxis protein CheW
MRPLPIKRVGAMPPAVLGLAVVRGVPLPVVDLRALVIPEARGEVTRFVTVRGATREVALAVGAVHRVATIDGPIAECPPLLGAENAGAIAALAALDGELAVVLRLAHLIPAGETS